MRAIRHVPALSVALVAAATLAGCSSSPASPGDDASPWSPGAANAGSAPKPLGAEPAPTEPAPPEPVDPASTPVTVLTKGRLSATTFVNAVSEAMLDAGSVTTTTRSALGGTPLENVVDLDMSTSDARLHSTGPDGVYDVLAVDGRLYVKGGKTKGKFYPLPPDDTTYSGLTLSADPVRPIRALYGSIVTATQTGDPVDVGGVLAQEYDLVVDTTTLQDGLGDLAAGIPRDQLPPTVTLSYWVGDDDLVHRATADIAGNPIEILYSGWGADLVIPAPEPTQLTTKPPR